MYHSEAHEEMEDAEAALTNTDNTSDTVVPEPENTPSPISASLI